jgi:hypothetical protein
MAHLDSHRKHFHEILCWEIFTKIRLRSIFGPKRDEVTGEWRKLQNEELNDLYSSPIILQVIKSRRMRWGWHVASVRGERFVQGFGEEM